MTHSKTFYLNDNKKFSSLKSFVKELVNMPKETFKHHVNDGKNDFALWIKHSIGNEPLAKKIEGKLDKIEMEIEVLRHLVHEIPKQVKKKIKTKNVTLKSTAKTTIKKTPIKKKKSISKK